jgi:hypothetical protein
MGRNLNALQWDGSPGHYEVYYLSMTDRASGLGAWIRYTMVAPLPDTGDTPTCSLWFMAMDPESPAGGIGRKASFPIAEMVAEDEPFKLRIGDSVLTDEGMQGGFEDVRWDVSWPATPGAEHVHPLLRRAKIAKTVLTLPHANFDVAGTLAVDGRTFDLDGARGGQAHLWGSKHALRWAWVHCNDFETDEGEPRPDVFVDGVSVFVPRFGRELGPNTPVVGRFGGRDFESTSPVTVVRNDSSFALTSWRFEARDGDRKIIGDVDAGREDLVGVTYHDPDGDLAYCYNSEIASMRVQVLERDGGQWNLVERLVAPGRAHFEYAQREPVPGLELHVK